MQVAGRSTRVAFDVTALVQLAGVAAAAAAPILKDAVDQKPKDARSAFYYAQSLLDQKQFADSLPSRSPVTGKSADQRGRNRFVPWQLARDLIGQVFEGQGK